MSVKLKSFGIKCMLFLVPALMLNLSAPAWAQEANAESSEMAFSSFSECSEIRQVLLEEILPSNAQVYFIVAVNCPTNESADIESQRHEAAKVARAIGLLGGIQNPLVAGRNAITFFEGKDSVSSDGMLAWAMAHNVLRQIRETEDVRELLYLISASEIMARVAESGSPKIQWDLGDIITREMRVNVFAQTGYEFLDSTRNGDAICFVKSDIGGSVSEVFQSDRFNNCILGER